MAGFVVFITEGKVQGRSSVAKHFQPPSSNGSVILLLSVSWQRFLDSVLE